MSEVASENLSVGLEVNIRGKTERKGTIRFVGPTKFATGEWVGVEFDAAEGKNNGTINGVEYFSCPENHGMFVRKSRVKQARQISNKQGRRIGLDSKLSKTTSVHQPTIPVPPIRIPTSESSATTGCIFLGCWICGDDSKDHSG